MKVRSRIYSTPSADREVLDNMEDMVREGS